MQPFWCARMRTVPSLRLLHGFVVVVLFDGELTQLDAESGCCEIGRRRSLALRKSGDPFDIYNGAVVAVNVPLRTDRAGAASYGARSIYDLTPIRVDSTTRKVSARTVRTLLHLLTERLREGRGPPLDQELLAQSMKLGLE